MLYKTGKRVVFTDATKKENRAALALEIGKHQGKTLKDLTAKQKDALLEALCKASGILGI